jgi:hypothetical protein
MRWFYIASIYVLAFTYSKIQFSSYLTQPKKAITVRAPASGKALSCKEIIAQFYPEQTKAFLKNRIEVNKDFHSFFRAFAPLFYKELRDDKEIQKLFLPLKKYQGIIAGDLHLENFGFIVDDKGKVFFNLNDFDDVTEGMLFQDLARHFLSAKIVDKDMSWHKFFKSYRHGLNSDPHSYSYYVEKGIEDVTDETEKVLKTYISSDEPLKFIKRKTPSRDIEADELTILKKALKDNFPKFEMHDQYVRIKEDGGSAGLIRFQVLGRKKPQDQIQWFDIKESAVSGYDKANETNVPFEKRIAALKDKIYSNRMDKSITILDIGGHPYSFRAVDQFATSIKLSDIPEDDYSDIIQDQAYVIGRMHRQSLIGEKDEYIKAWENLDADEIEKSLEKLKDRLKILYKSER